MENTDGTVLSLSAEPLLLFRKALKWKPDKYGRSFETADTDCFKYSEDTSCYHIGCIFRNIKADLHMGLCSQIINLIRSDLSDQLYKADGISKISKFQMKCGVPSRWAIRSLKSTEDLRIIPYTS